MIRIFFAGSLLALTLACTDAGRDAASAPPPSPPTQSRAVTEEPMVLASGVTIQFTQRATNEGLLKPGPTTEVRVHYEGSLVSDGSVFDSSFERGEPADFALNQVVPGFSEAIQQMRPGDEVIATFPPAMGYGAAGRPPVIPPNSALRFRILLISFRGADGVVVGGP